MLTHQYNEHLFPEQFYCPKCYCIRPYVVKRVSVGTRFYYIKLFATENLDQVIECRFCKKSFDPGVLEPNNQNLIRLATIARDRLSCGSTPEKLQDELTSAGIKKELTEKLILLTQI
jgi:hypothetical protein